ncbi:hypothetical protein Efla_004971 [Eimeria flavescens]
MRPQVPTAAATAAATAATTAAATTATASAQQQQQQQQQQPKHQLISSISSGSRSKRCGLVSAGSVGFVCKYRTAAAAVRAADAASSCLAAAQQQQQQHQQEQQQQEQQGKMSFISSRSEAAAAASAAAALQQQQQQQRQRQRQRESVAKTGGAGRRGSTSSSQLSLGGGSSHNLPASTDVVIVGAGPTGLCLALSLARQGVSFVIIDATLEATKDSRAIAIQSRTLEVLEDLGVASSFLLLGNRCRAVELWLSGRRAVSVGLQQGDQEAVPVRLPPLKALTSLASGGRGGVAAAAETPELAQSCSSGSPFPFAVTIPQAITCQILESKLAELGHKIYRPVAVWQIEGFDVEDPSCFPVQQQQEVESLLSRGDSGGSSFRSPHEFLEEGGPPEDQQQQPQQQQQQQQVGDTLAEEALNGPLGYPVTVHFGWYLPRLPAAEAQAAERGAADAPAGPAEEGPPVRFGRLRCRYVVGCDGARSVVRKAGGIAFEGRTNPKSFIVADVSFAPAVEEEAVFGNPIVSGSPLQSPAATAARGAAAGPSHSAESSQLLSRSSSCVSPAGDPQQQQQQQQQQLACNLLGCEGTGGMLDMGPALWAGGLLTGLGRRLHAAAAAALEPGETERARLTALGRRAAAGDAVEIHLTPKGFAACIPMLKPPSKEDFAAATGGGLVSRRSSSSSNSSRRQQQLLLQRYSSRVAADAADRRWRVVIERHPEVAAAAAAAGAAPRDRAAASAAAAAACAAAAEEEAEPPATPLTRRDSQTQSRAELVQQIERVFVGCRVTELYWSAVYRTGTRVASAFRRQRLLLAGDAAHIQPPVLGQGMNLGMQDAYNLGWKLGRVLRQAASPQLLQSYEEEAQQAANQVVRLTDRLFDLVLSASSSSGLLPRLLLRVAAPLAVHLPGVARSFSQTLLMTHIAYRYPSVALGTGDASFMQGAAPGLRVPDCLVKVARLPRTGAADPAADPVAGYLFELFGRGRHLLLLHVMLLPPGSRKQNIFGCEIAGAPLVARYNNEAVSTLARLCQLSVLAAGKSAAGAAAAAAVAAASSLPFVGDPRTAAAAAAAAAAAGVALVSAAPSLGGPFSAADFADDIPWRKNRARPRSGEETDEEEEEEEGDEEEEEGDEGDEGFSDSESFGVSTRSSRDDSPLLPSTPAAAAAAAAGGGSVLRRHTAYPDGSAAAAAPGGAAKGDRRQVQLWSSDLRVVWCLHGPAAAVHTTATANSITSEIVRSNTHFASPSPRPRSCILPQQQQQQQQQGGSDRRWEGKTEECQLLQRPLLQLVPPALVQQMQQASSSSSGGAGGFVLVDFLSDMQGKFGLSLADPNAADGADSSGGFSLIRPDGVLAFCGRAGDSKAARGLLDYLIRF